MRNVQRDAREGLAMKITDSAIQLYSQHASLSKNEQSESLTVWKNGQEPETVADTDGKGKNHEALNRMFMDFSVKVSLSAQAQQRLSAQDKTGRGSSDSADIIDLKSRILQSLIERLTGRKMQISHVGAIIRAEAGSAAPAPAANQQAVPATQGNNGGGGAIYTYHASQYESQSTSFTAQGKILTADGREINFSTQLNMSSESYSEQDVSIKSGQALKDPLVVNFSGTAAQLTQTQFQFDLNADGAKESMAFVAPGSGFLALDKNGDGAINNGSELFGPGSGNGFQDLAAYDSDGNGWIDENDPVFNSLRIWTKDGAGNDQLFTLGQKGVGALYLGSAATPFSLKNADNTLAGQVRSTGIFLGENGTVGTLQQVDLVA